jgi:hypothetical protein
VRRRRPRVQRGGCSRGETRFGFRARAEAARAAEGDGCSGHG